MAEAPGPVKLAAPTITPSTPMSNSNDRNRCPGRKVDLPLGAAEAGR
jgi:hypothetical protein